MTDPTTAAEDAFDAGTQAIVMAQEHAAALEIARKADSDSLIAKVDEHLKEFNQQNKKDLHNIVLNVLGDVFGPDESTYVVKNRVPLLCQSVAMMKDTMIEIKEMIIDNKKDSDIQHLTFVTKNGEYWIIRTIVFTGAGIVLVGALAAILKFVYL